MEDDGIPLRIRNNLSKGIGTVKRRMMPKAELYSMRMNPWMIKYLEQQAELYQCSVSNYHRHVIQRDMIRNNYELVDPKLPGPKGGVIWVYTDDD